MNIFSESNYQVILRSVVEERKAIDAKFNFQTIAEATRIPKSYLSKVTTEKAHFSPDQLYAVCDCIGFSELQTRYMILLLEYERSSVKKRREALKRDIDTIRDRALDSSEHLKAKPDQLSEESLRDYYMDPLNQLVHICLSIPRYQADPPRLAVDLGMPAGDLRVIIERLETLGIVERQGGKLRTVVKSIHLPRSSPAYRPWRNQLKLMCLERMSRRMARGDYSFSVTFSATPKARDKIKAEFLDFLKRVEELAQASKHEEAYQMNFDLFSWTEAE